MASWHPSFVRFLGYLRQGLPGASGRPRIIPNTLEDAERVGGYMNIVYVRRTLGDIAGRYGLQVFASDDGDFTLDGCSALLDGELMIVFAMFHLSQTGLLAVAAKQAQPQHHGRILRLLIEELQLKPDEYVLDEDAFPGVT